MKAIFGSAVNSLDNVSYNLIERGVNPFVPINGKSKKDIAGVESASIVLLNTVALFRYLAKYINKNAVVVIFDSPINLSFIKSLKYLDCKRKSSHDMLSFKWSLKSIDYNTIIKATKLTKQVSPKVGYTDFLPFVLENKMSGTLMQPINNLIYNSTNHITRMPICHFIWQWGSGEITAKNCTAKIKTILEMNTVRTSLINELYKVMNSEYGKNIVMAIKERNAVKNEGKAVQYKLLVKNYNVDINDLKGIVNLEGNEDGSF